MRNFNDFRVCLFGDYISKVWDDVHEIYNPKIRCKPDDHETYTVVFIKQKRQKSCHHTAQWSNNCFYIL